jgi:RHS repeat-associated protein
MKPRVSSVQQPASNWERTYYIHDAQGNPMAIYHRTYQANGGTSYTDRFKQEDALIYGSKRLGNWHGARLKTRGLTSATTAMTSVAYGTAPDWTNGQGGYPTTALSVSRELGLRHYELSNHLGNVLSTVSDRRLAMASGGLVAYYRADEKSYADYDPYGMLLPGRFGGGFADQNFGFQGQLKDDELNASVGTSYAFEYRVHDPRVGRFLSVDPLAAKYPWNSSYAFSENRVIDGFELEGLEHLNNKYYVWQNAEGKAVISLFDSHEAADPGPKGWGVSMRFYDGITKKEIEGFTAFATTEAPIFWMKPWGSLYIGGRNFGGRAGSLEGERGYENGGKQAMFGTFSFVAGGFGVVAAGRITLLQAWALLNDADDMSGASGAGTLMDKAFGEEFNQNQKLLEGALSLFSSSNTTLKGIVKEMDTGKEYENFFIDLIGTIDDEMNELMNVKDKLTDD